MDVSTPVAWTLVRCPVHGHVLGEVAGSAARLRKKCTECRRFWQYDNGTGQYVVEPATITTAPQLVTIASP